MPVFDVESTDTAVCAARGLGRTAVTWIIEVFGPWTGSGRDRARFVFGEGVEREGAAPIGYLTDAGAGGLSLIGWLPAADYAAHRRIIDAGGPLRVHYETRDGGPGYLRRLALGRADAPPLCVTASRQRAGGREAGFAMPL